MSDPTGQRAIRAMGSTWLVIERRPSSIISEDLLHPDLGPDGLVRLGPGEVLRWHGAAAVRELRYPAGRRRGHRMVTTWALAPAGTVVVTNRRVAYLGANLRTGGAVVSAAAGAVFAGHMRFQWLQDIRVGLRQVDGVTVAVMLLPCLAADDHVIITVALKAQGGMAAETLATRLAAALADDVARFRVEVQGAAASLAPACSTGPDGWEWDLPGSLPFGSRPGPPAPTVPEHLAPALKALLSPMAVKPSVKALRRAVDRYPVLLSGEVDQLFGRMIESARLSLDPTTLHMMYGIRTMLRRWREAGPDAAMDKLVQTVLAIDPANRAVWGFQLLIDAGSSAEVLATLSEFPDLHTEGGLAAVDAFIRENAGDGPQTYELVAKYRRLLDRCQQVGAPTAVAELDVQVGLPDDLVAAQVGADRALPDDLDEIVRQRTIVLNHPALPPAQYPDAAIGAAKAHWLRFGQRGGIDDLTSTIDLCQAALHRLPPHAPERIEIEGNLAIATMDRYSRTGDLSDLEAAAGILRTVAKHRRDAPTAANLGAALVEQFRRFQRPQDLAEGVAAYGLATSLAPASSQLWPGCTFGLAQALLLQHRETDDAGELQRATVLLQSIVDRVPRGSTDLPLFLDGLASALLAADRLDEAVATYEEALHLLPSGSPRRAGILNSAALASATRYQRTRHPADNDAAARMWRESCRAGADTSPEAVLLAASNWSESALAAGDWTAALEAAHAGMATIEYLVRIQPQRQHREAWLSQARQFVARGAYGAARADDPRAAAALLERGRTLLLADKFADAERTLLALQVAGHGDTADRYRQAAAAAATVNALPQPRVDDLRRARDAVEQAIAAVRLIDGFATFMASPTFTDIAAAALGHTIVYLAATEHGGLAVVVDGRTPNAPTLSIRWLDRLAEQAVVDITRRLLRTYGRRSTARDAWVAALEETTNALWDIVIEPLRDILPHDVGLTIVPCGLLGLLPLHAAWTPDSSQPTGRRYALDEFLITYAPHARALRRVEPSMPVSLLGVDTDLPCGRDEVETAGRLFKTAATLHGEDASLQRILPMLDQFAVLHFACHGAMDPFRPLDGGLLLAGRQLLTLRDILAQPPLIARLAVLSACETAIAGADLPDEALSLPTGLLQAGAAAVIGSFWAVPDRETARLMINFYERWAATPANPAQALRDAQRWLRDTTHNEFLDRQRDIAPVAGSYTTYSLIEHWAAFAYYGS